MTLPEQHATEEGPPLKMIKLTAHHLGFDDDVFPPESKPKNVFATKSKPKTNERPSKPKSKNISARSSTANVKEKNIPEDEKSVIVVPQKKKKRPKHLKKKEKWGKLLKRGKDLAKQLQDKEKRVFTGGRRNSGRSRKKEKDTEEEKEEEEDVDEEEDEEKKEEYGKKRKRESILGKVMPEPCNQCGEIFETPAALEIHRVQEYC